MEESPISLLEQAIRMTFLIQIINQLMSDQNVLIDSSTVPAFYHVNVTFLVQTLGAVYPEAQLLFTFPCSSERLAPPSHSLLPQSARRSKLTRKRPEESSVVAARLRGRSQFSIDSPRRHFLSPLRASCCQSVIWTCRFHSHMWFNSTH